MSKQSSYLLANGLRVHYLHWQADGGGRPVILVHGLASNARIWELMAPDLLQAGLAPLAPDGRGHGLTDKPDGDYGFEVFRGDLLAFLDALNLEAPILVGHSWGASIVLDYAAQIRFGPCAPAGVVLVDGAIGQMDTIPGVTWEQMKARLTPPRLAGTPLASFLAMLSNPQRSWQIDEQAIPIILANFDISADETISPHLSFEHHMQIVRALWEIQTYQLYSQVRCPVLMIAARPPASSSNDGEHLALKEHGMAVAREKIAHLETVWLEDSIHDIPLQHPQVLARLIVDFAAKL